MDQDRRQSDDTLEPTLVIPTASHGASSHGLSYWLSFLGCRRKRTLEAQFEGEEKHAANVGTIFHQLMEFYYNGELESCAMKYQEGPEDPAWQEALRLFKEYRTRFPSNEFGEVVGCEVPIETDDPSVVGVGPFSGRIDMVVDIKDELYAAELWESRKLVVEPGIYLLDTKTKGKMSAHMPIQMNESLQFAAYQHLWNTLHPETPCKGMIANVVVRHKNLVDRSFFSILVGPPSDHQLDVLNSTLIQCKNMRDVFGEDYCNTTQCFTYGACTYLTNGMCRRL